MLPEIRSSSEHYGTVCDGSVLDGIPITGVSCSYRNFLRCQHHINWDVINVLFYLCRF